MQFQDEGARIVEESIPAGLPSCDLTDDFLADLDQFIDSSLFEQPSGLLAGETPADASMDIPTEAGQLEAGSSLDPPADAAASNSDPRQRKLQSNRLAQARLRERKKAGHTPGPVSNKTLAVVHLHAWFGQQRNSGVAYKLNSTLLLKQPIANMADIYAFPARPGRRPWRHSLQKPRPSSDSCRSSNSSWKPGTLCLSTLQEYTRDLPLAQKKHMIPLDKCGRSGWPRCSRARLLCQAFTVLHGLQDHVINLHLMFLQLKTSMTETAFAIPCLQFQCFVKALQDPLQPVRSF